MNKYEISYNVEISKKFQVDQKLEVFDNIKDSADFYRAFPAFSCCCEFLWI